MFDLYLAYCWVHQNSLLASIFTAAPGAPTSERSKTKQCSQHRSLASLLGPPPGTKPAPGDVGTVRFSGLFTLTLAGYH